MNRLLAAILLLIPFAGVAEPTLAEVDRQVRQAWEGVHALRAELAVKTRFQMGLERVDSESAGTLAYRKDGAQEKYRIRAGLKGGLGEKLAKGAIETLFDGATLYRINAIGANRQARIIEANVLEQTTPPGGGRLLDCIKAQCEIKAVRETQCDGVPAFALECLPKNHGGVTAVKRLCVYLDRELGLQRKAVFFGEQGEEVSVLTLSNVTVNPDLAAESFTAPPAASAPR